MTGKLWEKLMPDLSGKTQEILNEAMTDAPKKYVYTDYTHDFGIDPQSEEFKQIKPEDYPKYVHVPDDKEWRAWYEKWFG